MNTFYHGDCKFVMNHDIEPESVDLIYLDPPFFTGKVQKGIAKWKPGEMPITYEDGKRFWKEKGIASNAPEWLKHIAIDRPDFAAYLFYMKERLEACHKVLKATGSIYLHCDEKASHYLKMIMDEIFGYQNFRSEVIWSYDFGGRSKERWPRKHDTILLYSMSNKWTFNYDTLPRIPYKSKIHEYRGSQEGKENGKTPTDVWDLPIVNTMAKERVGYPTQKPLALLERIIKASSNEENVVLDPFCGCGTAIIAAQRLHRQWIGIDISKDAYEISSKRQGELPLDFTHLNYVSRDLEEIGKLEANDFEKWVNEFYDADKPRPDKGVDGVTKNGIAIQSKTGRVDYSIVSQFLSDAQLHTKVIQPVKQATIVSQAGFDDSARTRTFEIKAKFGIDIQLKEPRNLINNDVT